MYMKTSITDVFDWYVKMFEEKWRNMPQAKHNTIIYNNNGVLPLQVFIVRKLPKSYFEDILVYFWISSNNYIYREIR